MSAARNASLIALWCLLGCSEPIDPGGEPIDEDAVSDPLDIPDETRAGSFDDLYARVIVHSCSGQAGLCHNGQFEPNLSTPGLAWVNLVERPSLEKNSRLRVTPGDPENSLLIDKLRNRDVVSQMPLGTKALDEADIAAFEAWVAGGARRRLESGEVPTIDNPPEEPTLAVFDSAGERLDLSGSATVTPGMEVVLRMTSHDFETADEDVPYAFFILQTNDGDLMLFDTAVDPDAGYVGYADFDAGGPSLGEEAFTWQYSWVVPDEIALYRTNNDIDSVPADGLSFILLGGYADTGPAGGAMALSFVVDAVRVSQ
jgi:hypothetical protein